jgi:hypothetical protein
MQTVAGLFPCQALLHRWAKAPSPQCLLCGGDTETVAHVQCWRPALKEARIAYIYIYVYIGGTYRSAPTRRPLRLRQRHVHTLSRPLDMLDPWNRMEDELLG